VFVVADDRVEPHHHVVFVLIVPARDARHQLAYQSFRRVPFRVFVFALLTVAWKNLH